MSIEQEVSRTPSDYSYEPKGHFHDKKEGRNVPGAAIRKCIEQGEVERQENGRICFKQIHNGKEYWLIVNPANNHCVTIFPKGIDDAELDKSKAWSVAGD